LLRAFPEERIVYFGDTARTPYGSKAPSTILKFAAEITNFLIGAKGVKMVAIACNTVSAIALDELRRRHPEVPIIGIIDPAAKAVANTCSPEGRIGVIGTKATIASEAYAKTIAGLAPGMKVYQQACPAFVPLIEEGIIRNHIMDLTIGYYLNDFLEYSEVDTLVLGCTHYPLIRENIVSLYPDLRIIDPSEELLGSIADELEPGNLRTDAGKPDHVFYASDLSENFINMIDRIFSGIDYKAEFDTFDFECFTDRKG
jgi:glutamate racemase